MLCSSPPADCSLPWHSTTRHRRCSRMLAMFFFFLLCFILDSFTLCSPAWPRTRAWTTGIHNHSRIGGGFLKEIVSVSVHRDSETTVCSRRWRPQVRELGAQSGSTAGSSGRLHTYASRPKAWRLVLHATPTSGPARATPTLARLQAPPLAPLQGTHLGVPTLRHQASPQASPLPAHVLVPIARASGPAPSPLGSGA